MQSAGVARERTNKTVASRRLRNNMAYFVRCDADCSRLPGHGKEKRPMLVGCHLTCFVNNRACQHIPRSPRGTTCACESLYISRRRNSDRFVSDQSNLCFVTYIVPTYTYRGELISLWSQFTVLYLRFIRACWW